MVGHIVAMKNLCADELTSHKCLCHENVDASVGMSAFRRQADKFVALRVGALFEHAPLEVSPLTIDSVHTPYPTVVGHFVQTFKADYGFPGFVFHGKAMPNLGTFIPRPSISSLVG